MAVSHMVVLAAVLLGLLCLPCVVAAAFAADGPVVQRAVARVARRGRFRRAWTSEFQANAAAHRHLDRNLRNSAYGPAKESDQPAKESDQPAGAARPVVPAGTAADPGDLSAQPAYLAPLICAGPVPCDQCEPGMEWLTGEIRRVQLQRRCGPALTSTTWMAATTRRYDQYLRLACHHLGIPEYLSELDERDETDRALERVRIEGRLQIAGLDLL